MTSSQDKSGGVAQIVAPSISGTSADYVPPADLLKSVTEASQKKVALSPGKMLVRGFLSGAFLAFATAFAFKVSAGLPENVAALVSSLVFPVGFAMIVILSLELATGSFGVLPVGLAQRKITLSGMLRNWGWVYVANFIGSLVCGFLIVIALTEAFTHGPSALGDKIIAVSESKTLLYEQAGALGWLTAVVKGILCNWMVAFGTILGLSSTSSIGKIASIWLPISTFFALGLEHSIVNMFLIPSAMMMGADISTTQWLVWNQIPVTLGNLIGGAFFTGLFFYWSSKE
ncbi:MAG: formate/nitrite transporter family protein [Candidatus Nanopelagicales bacterium]|nr:formate/nitrite transporter family protein [Candidatus Nanopelagicales bacterium]MDZ4250463.1 formate/nitrite transporter family protein [Candidatus Nanopelagicales bacterium]